MLYGFQDKWEGVKMANYTQVLQPDIVGLAAEIKKSMGDRSLSAYVTDFRLQCNGIAMSTSKMHRIINGGNVKPFKIEELEAFAAVAAEGSGVTLDSLAKLNGMRDEDAENTKSDVLGLRRQQVFAAERHCGMILKSEITDRGYFINAFNGNVRSGFMSRFDDDKDRPSIFSRQYNLKLSVSGMSPCNIWKFAFDVTRLDDEERASADMITARTRYFINRFSGVFASDSIEGDLYEGEKFSFVFADEALYEGFLDKVKEIKVNGLITAILISFDEGKVLKETQLVRYDGLKAPSVFTAESLYTDEDSEEDWDLYDPFDIDEE